MLNCCKCGKELKDSDNYWKAWNGRMPILGVIYICAKCMKKFKEEKPNDKA